MTPSNRIVSSPYLAPENASSRLSSGFDVSIYLKSAYAVSEFKQIVVFTRGVVEPNEM